MKQVGLLVTFWPDWGWAGERTTILKIRKVGIPVVTLRNFKGFCGRMDYKRSGREVGGEKRTQEEETGKGRRRRRAATFLLSSFLLLPLPTPSLGVNSEELLRMQENQGAKGLSYRDVKPNAFCYLSLISAHFHLSVNQMECSRLPKSWLIHQFSHLLISSIVLPWKPFNLSKT